MTFVSAGYIQKNTSVIKTEANIKECLNKKRLNLKRKSTNTPESKQKQKKPKKIEKPQSDDDETDVSSFLVVKLDAESGCLDKTPKRASLPEGDDGTDVDACLPVTQ